MPDPRRLCQDAGQSLVEYALLLLLVGLVALFSMQAVGRDVSVIFDDVSSALSPTAGNGGGNGNGWGAGGNGQGNNGNGQGNGGPSGNPPGNSGGGGGGGGGGRGGK